MSVNLSKVKNPWRWAQWRSAGAVGTITRNQTGQPNAGKVDLSRLFVARLKMIVTWPKARLFKEAIKMGPELQRIINDLSARCRQPQPTDVLSDWSTPQIAALRLALELVGRQANISETLFKALYCSKEVEPVYENLKAEHERWLLKDSRLILFEPHRTSREALKENSRRFCLLSKEKAEEWSATVDVAQLSNMIRTAARNDQARALDLGLTAAELLFSPYWDYRDHAYHDMPPKLNSLRELVESPDVAAALTRLDDESFDRLPKSLDLNSILKKSFDHNPPLMTEAAVRYLSGVKKNSPQALSLSLASLLAYHCPDRLAALFAPSRMTERRALALGIIYHSQHLLASRHWNDRSRVIDDEIPDSPMALACLAFKNAPFLSFAIWDDSGSHLSFDDNFRLLNCSLQDFFHYALNESSGLDVEDVLAVTTRLIKSAFSGGARERPLKQADLGQYFTITIQRRIDDKMLATSDLMVEQAEQLFNNETIELLTNRLQPRLTAYNAFKTKKTASPAYFPFSYVEDFAYILYNIALHLKDFSGFDCLISNLGPGIMDPHHMINRYKRHQMGHSSHPDPRISFTQAHQAGFDYFDDFGQRVWKLTHPGEAPPVKTNSYS